MKKTLFGYPMSSIGFSLVIFVLSIAYSFWNSFWSCPSSPLPVPILYTLITGFSLYRMLKNEKESKSDKEGNTSGKILIELRKIEKAIEDAHSKTSSSEEETLKIINSSISSIDDCEVNLHSCIIHSKGLRNKKLDEKLRSLKEKLKQLSSGLKSRAFTIKNSRVKDYLFTPGQVVYKEETQKVCDAIKEIRVLLENLFKEGT